MSQFTAVFVDLDGTLCDYYGGVCRVFGAPAWPYPTRALGDWNFYHHFPAPKTTADIAPHMGREFYAGLDWLPDGARVLALAEKLVGEKNVFFLTSPWDTPGCFDGKLDWVKKHAPGYSRRLLVGSPKQACSFPGALLLDDSVDNCGKFLAVKNPGHAVLIPRPWNERHPECCLKTGAVVNWDAVARELHGSPAPPPHIPDAIP